MVSFLVGAIAGMIVTCIAFGIALAVEGYGWVYIVEKWGKR